MMFQGKIDFTFGLFLLFGGTIMNVCISERLQKSVTKFIKPFT